MPTEILIAEDDRSLATSLAKALEKLGYACRQVHDGAAALQAISEAPPDAILLDLLLPKKDGHVVLETLQLSDATSSIPVIAMSGVFRGHDQETVLERAGARAFLPKPFSVADLKASLHRIVGPPRREVSVDESVERVDLSVECAASVIWRAMAERFTGALNFQHRKRHKVLILDDGQPSFVRSNLAREALGRRLLAVGRIDERTLNDSLRRAKQTGQRQGDVLVELGAVSASDVREALRQQSEDKLLELFSWTAGAAWRQEGVRQVSAASELSGWTPQRVMLQGVLRADPEMLRRALEPYARCTVERGSADLDEKTDHAGEHPLLDALDDSDHVSQLIDDHLPALYALWKMGVVEVEGTVSHVMRASGKALSSQITELQARLEEIGSLDHFEVLGLARNAPVAEVRKAFVEQAKSCHPDKLGGKPAEVRDLAAQVFARLSDAHETLSEPGRREAYVKDLASGGGKPADRKRVARILTAEQQFQKAEACARRKDWEGCLESVEHALQLDPEEGEFHALRGWATFMRSPEDPEVRSSALQALQKAGNLAPKSPNAWFYLGRLHRVCESLPEAERMFRKVLEVRPGHTEAQQELRLLERRRNEGGGKGLFGRLRKQ